jgi:hypothetical protein
MSLKSAAVEVVAVTTSKEYFNPRKITGLDIAGNAVNFSKQNYRQKGLYYKQEMQRRCRLTTDILM